MVVQIKKKHKIVRSASFKYGTYKLASNSNIINFIFLFLIRRGAEFLLRLSLSNALVMHNVVK